MPTFTIKDPDTGRTIHMTGDKPPAESDIKAAFAQEPQQSQQPAINPMNDLTSGASGVMRGLGLGVVPDAVSSLMNMPKEAGALMGNQQAKQQYTQGVANNAFTDPNLSQAINSGDKNQVGSAVSQLGTGVGGFNNAMGLATDVQGGIGAIKSLPLLTKAGAVQRTGKAVQAATAAGKTAKWDDIANEVRTAVKSQYGNSVEHMRAVNKFLAQEVPAKLGKNVTKTPTELLQLRRQILARTGTGNIIQKLMNVKTTEDQVAGVARNVVSKYVHQLAPESQAADKAYTLWKKLHGSPAEWAMRYLIGNTAGTIGQAAGIPKNNTEETVMGLMTLLAK